MNKLSQKLEKLFKLLKKQKLKDASFNSAKLDELVKDKAIEEGLDIKLKPSKVVIAFKVLLTFAVITLFTGVYLYMYNRTILVKVADLIMNRRPTDVVVELAPEKVEALGVASDTKYIDLKLSHPLASTDQDVKDNIKITPDVDFDIEVVSEDTIRIKPKTDLNKGEVYQVTLKQGLALKDDKYLKDSITVTIPVSPKFNIVATTPSDNGQMSIDGAIQLFFNDSNFDLEDVKKHFKITPNIKGRFVKYDNVVSFVPQTKISTQVLYKVTVKSGIKNTKTGETINKDTVFTFTVVDPNAWEDMDEVFTVFGGVYQNVTDDKLFIYTAPDTKNIRDSIIVTIYKIDDNELINIAKQISQKGKFIATTNTYKKVGDYHIEQFKGDTLLLRYYVKLDKKVGNGAYVAELHSSKYPWIRDYMLFNRSDFVDMVNLDTSQDKLNIWTFNKSSKLISGVNHSIYACGKDSCKQYTTISGKNGFSTVSLDSKIPHIFVISKSKSGGVAVTFLGDKSIGSAIFMFNKPIYAPGEVLKASIAVRLYKGGTLAYPDKDTKYRLELKRSESVIDDNLYEDPTVFSQDLVLDNSKGILNVKVKVPNDPGSYYFMLYQILPDGSKKQIDGSFNFSVLEYFLDNNNVLKSFRISKKLYKDGENIVITGRIVSASGVGVKGKTLKVGIATQGFVFSDKDFKLDKDLRNYWYSILTNDSNFISKKVTTNSSGNFKVVVPVKDVVFNQFDTVLIQANVEGDEYLDSDRYAMYTDGYGLILKDNSVYSINGKLDLDLYSVKSPEMSIRPNVKYRVKVTREYSVKVLDGYYYDYETNERKPDYRYEDKTEVLFDKTIVTDSKGRYHIDINGLKEGSYKLEVYNVKTGKNINIGLSSVIKDADEITDNLIVNAPDIDKPIKVGDTLNFSVVNDKSTGKDTVMSIHSIGLKSWKVLHLKKGMNVKFKVPDSIFGYVEVCFFNVNKRDEVTVDSVNCTKYTVNNPKYSLDLDVKFDKDKYNPGDEVKAEFTVKDKQGNVLPGVNIGLAVTNSSFKDLYIASYYYNEAGDQDLMPAYWDIPIVPSVNILAFQRFDGGLGAGPSPSLRKDFNDAPAFITPDMVTTNAQGKAYTTFKLSEDITTWIAKIWVLDKDKAYIGYRDIKVVKKVYTDVTLPKKVYTGEVISLPVYVFNDNEQDIKGTLKVISDSSGVNVSKDITVPSKGSNSIAVSLKIPTKVEDTKIKVEFYQKGKLVDGLEKTLNVRAPYGQGTYSQFGVLTSHNNFIKTNLDKDINKDSIHAKLFVQDLSDFYTSGCKVPSDTNVETDAICLYKITNGVDSGVLEFRQYLPLMQEYASYILSMQDYNGGFKLHSNSSASAQVTARVMLALANYSKVLKDNGYSLSEKEQSALNLAKAYLVYMIASKDTSLDTKALMVYDLSILDSKLASAYYWALKQSLYNDIKIDKDNADAYLVLGLTAYKLNDTATAIDIIKKVNLFIKSGDNTAFLDTTDRLYDTSIATYLQYLIKEKIDATNLSKMQAWLAMSSCQQDYSGSYKGAMASVYYVASFGNNLDTVKEVSVKINDNEIYKGTLDTGVLLDVSKYLMDDPNSLVKVDFTGDGIVLVKLDASFARKKIKFDNSKVYNLLDYKVYKINDFDNIKVLTSKDNPKKPKYLAGTQVLVVAKIKSDSPLRTADAYLWAPSTFEYDYFYLDYTLKKLKITDYMFGYQDGYHDFWQTNLFFRDYDYKNHKYVNKTTRTLVFTAYVTNTIKSDYLILKVVDSKDPSVVDTFVLK